MKKLLTLLLLTAAFLTGCKKEDYSTGEFYDVVYTTVADTMTVNLSSTMHINHTNLNEKTIKKFDDQNILYKIPMIGLNNYKIEFIKVDGTTFKLELKKSEKTLNITF